MVASMTGYGRAERSDALGRVVVELKAVNHRFLQLDCQLPYGFAWAESPLRQRCEGRIHRGKVTLHLSVYDLAPPGQFHLNVAALRQLLAGRRQLEDELGCPLPASFDGLLQLPGMLKSEARSDDQEAQWQRLEPVVDAAIAAFVDNRRKEGEALTRDLASRRATLGRSLAAIRERLPAHRAEFEQRFAARVRELAAKAGGLDEARLATEIAIWAEKADVAEEVTRFAAHLEQFDRLLAGDGPRGRQLDFLVQEINREANTMGSKIGDLAIVQQVLEVKGELERVREQIQNLE